MIVNSILKGFWVVKMSRREVYLAKTRISPTLRAHFAIFIPNENCDRPKTDLTIDFWLRPSIGTIIHVVGEPAVAGFSFEVKRNFDTSTERFLQEMILLGSVDPMHLSGANNAIDITDDAVVRDREPKGRLEEVAALVTPPPGGQNIRIPVNGVRTLCLH